MKNLKIDDKYRLWGQLKELPIKKVKGARTYAANKFQKKNQRITKLEKMVKKEQTKITREDVRQDNRKKRLTTLEKLKEVRI